MDEMSMSSFWYRKNDASKVQRGAGITQNPGRIPPDGYFVPTALVLSP